MSMLLKASLGSPEWMRENLSKLKAIFPETWTHSENVSMLKWGYQLKVVGVDWRSEQELVNVMVYLTKVGVVQVNNEQLIRRAP
jgi:hypothetical protein